MSVDLASSRLAAVARGIAIAIPAGFAVFAALIVNHDPYASEPAVGTAITFVLLTATRYYPGRLWELYSAGIVIAVGVTVWMLRADYPIALAFTLGPLTAGLPLVAGVRLRPKR
jgi:hypothetical protein